MPSPLRTEDAVLRDRLRTIILVRWLGVLFGIVQVLSYQTLPYPPGIREAALALVAVLAVSNGAAEAARRHARTSGEVLRLGLVVLVVDVVVVSGLTWVYAFDSLSAIFAVLFLLPIEAAVLFGLPGAVWTWGAVAALYVGREWFGTRYGNPFEPDSVTFRVGLIGIVALIVGLLVRDLVDQRRATTAALRDAERVEASRSRLISMLAHDVRAPIATVRAVLGTIHEARAELDEEQLDQVLVAGQRQADRALLLARDLLDLARAEAGTLTVTPEVVELGELVEHVREVVPGGAELEVEFRATTVWADPARLEQVLFNLVDNAAKYGSPPVTLTADQDGDTVVLAVRDHGPGVAPGVELFTPFSAAGEGSVGLGVWIVRELVQAMGGDVHHEDADPGVRFVVRLPQARAPRDDVDGEGDVRP